LSKDKLTPPGESGKNVATGKSVTYHAIVVGLYAQTISLLTATKGSGFDCEEAAIEGYDGDLAGFDTRKLLNIIGNLHERKKAFRLATWRSDAHRHLQAGLPK